MKRKLTIAAVGITLVIGAFFGYLVYLGEFGSMDRLFATVVFYGSIVLGAAACLAFGWILLWLVEKRFVPRGLAVLIYFVAMIPTVHIPSYTVDGVNHLGSRYGFNFFHGDSGLGASIVGFVYMLGITGLSTFIFTVLVFAPPLKNKDRLK